MFAETMQGMLEAEMDTHLGYEKHEDARKATSNRRNGHSNKSVRSDYGSVELDVPRDRESDFEPIIIKKAQRNVTGIEDQIIALYAKGISTRDIQAHLEQLYGMIVNKAAYMVIGIDMDGQKDVLDMRIGENETFKIWHVVLNELKNRGVEDILIVSVDNLKGFNEAIAACYPQSEIPKCIVHKIKKLIDLHLDGAIDRENYDKKLLELNTDKERLIKESNKPLKKFDADVFESIAEKIILGGIDDKGQKIPIN